MTSPAAPTQIVHHQSSTLSRTVEYLEVKPGMAVVRLTYAVEHPEGTPLDLRERYKSTTKEGFATLRDIEMLCEGTLTTLKFDTDLQFVPNDVLEQSHELDFHDTYKLIPNLETPYTAYLEGLVTADDLVRMVVYSSTMLDYHGNPLPQPLTFDYIEGYFRDGAYRLDVALKLLAANPRVRPVKQRRLDRDDLHIRAVPGYNARGGCRSFIAFSFTPSAAELNRMCAHDPQALTRSESRRKAVFDLDLLGLRAGGAAKFADYEKCDDDTDEDSDES